MKASAKTATAILLVLLSRAAIANEINIAVGDWPPYLSSELKNSGVVAHLISDIFNDEGYNAKISILPWPRAYAEAAQGLKDATGVWMHKAERENDFHYSDHLLEEQFVFFHLKTFNFQWEELEDLQELVIGGGIKYSYGTEFDAALESGMLTMERVMTDKQNFEKLLRNRVQIYPQEINVAYSVLSDTFSKERRQKITHHAKPLLNNFSYVLFPKKNPNSLTLMKKFNHRLKQYRESGKYDLYFEAFKRGDYEINN